jgi:hypothetical protein
MKKSNKHILKYINYSKEIDKLKGINAKLRNKIKELN